MTSTATTAPIWYAADEMQPSHSNIRARRLPWSHRFEWLARSSRCIPAPKPLLGVATALVFFAVPASADFVSFNGSEVAPNIAVIDIEDNAVRIELEILPDDLSVFEDLLPDSWIPGESPQRANDAARRARFADNGLTVARDDGRVLPLTVERIEPRLRVDRASPLAGRIDPVSGQRIPAPPSDPRVVFAELIYDFGNERPERLRITPPLDGDIPSVSIGMILFDRGVPVTDFRFLPKEVNIEIDWHDPWFTRFDNSTFRRTQREGIATFLYVEPREVRHETLIRVRDVARWLGRDMEAGETLSPELRDRIAADTAALFESRNPVKIDGNPVKPADVRSDLLALGERGFSIVEPGREVGADSAFVGVILSFPVDHYPETIEVTWDMFDARLLNVPATLYDAAGPFISGATPEDSLISWENHLLTYDEPEVAPVPAPALASLGLPVLSLAILAVSLGLGGLAVFRTGRSRLVLLAIGLTGIIAAVGVRDIAVLPLANLLAQQPSESEAENTVAGVLASVSASFNLPVEDQRTAALGSIVTARSLNDVAAELDRGLAVRVPGGGLARIETIRDLSLDATQPLPGMYGFQTIAEWSIEARAGHWGHDHRRRVDYRAILDVVAEEGSWKLDGLTVLEARIPDA
ncbi:MAG: hypothetical protein GY798_30630 [Hyphomicrobiales bacterium]|nr:hypothetical protein [Hyphomicrobiales bacterium]